MLVPPLPDVVTFRVGIDAGMQRVGSSVEEHVQDFVTSRSQASHEFVPVLLVEHGLYCDEMLLVKLTISSATTGTSARHGGRCWRSVNS